MLNILFSGTRHSAGRSTAHRLGLAGLAILAGLSAAGARTTYTVDQKIKHGSVTGLIVTTGKLGKLAADNIVAWSLELKGPGASFRLTQKNSVVQMFGEDLRATTKNLIYNYSGKDSGILAFVVSPGSGAQYWCNGVTSQGDCAPGASVVPQSYNDPSAQYAARKGQVKIATKRVSKDD